MKKNAIKSIVFFLVAMLLFSPLALTAQASQVPDTTFHIHYDDEIGIEGLEVCSGLPYHDLLSAGWGTAWQGSNVFTTMLVDGYSWLCRNCGYLLVTQGADIPNGGNIGYYCTGVTYSDVTVYYNLFNANGPYGPINSSQLAGYKFSWAPPMKSPDEAR